MSAQTIKYAIQPLCPDINQEVFGARIFLNDIYVVSYENQITPTNKDNRNTSNSKSQTDIIAITNCKVEAAELFSAKHQQNITVNSRFNDGPISGNQNADFLLFSNNSDMNIWPQMGIFMLTSLDNGWSESISFPLNSGEYSCIHPFYDEQGERVLFSSNMPGGDTKYAIYSIPFDGKNFGQAEKLDQISSEGNNLFPSVYKQRIYFTSDRSGGMGGMDIYTWNGGSVQLLPEPINSPFDDLAYVHIDELLGFVSSNRMDEGKTDQTYFFQLNRAVDPEPNQPSAIAQQNSAINQEFKESQNFFQNNLVQSKNNNSYVAQQLVFNAANQKMEESSQLIQSVNQNASNADNNLDELTKEITSMLFQEDLDVLLKKIEFLNQTRALIEQIHSAENPAQRDSLFQRLESHINQFDPNLSVGLDAQIKTLQQTYKAIDRQHQQIAENQQTLQELTIASLLVEAKLRDISVEELYKQREQEMNQMGVQLAHVTSPKNISNNTKELIVAQSDTMIILFNFDSYFVSDEQILKLNQLLFVCQTIAGLHLSIEGHTDNVGPANYNLLLSQKRARSVQNQLVKKGIQDEKFQIRYFGLTKPRNANATSQEKSLNRRVEIQLVHIK